MIGRRSEDGDVDRVRIDRACNGQAVALSPTELKLAVYRLHTTRHMGLDQIADHLGYSRTRVASLLAQIRQQ